MISFVSDNGRVRGETYPHYPTANEKELLARHIVDNVPEIRLVDRKNPLGFVSISNPFI